MIRFAWLRAMRSLVTSRATAASVAPGMCRVRSVITRAPSPALASLASRVKFRMPCRRRTGSAMSVPSSTVIAEMLLPGTSSAPLRPRALIGATATSVCRGRVVVERQVLAQGTAADGQHDVVDRRAVDQPAQFAQVRQRGGHRAESPVRRHALIEARDRHAAPILPRRLRQAFLRRGDERRRQLHQRIQHPDGRRQVGRERTGHHRGSRRHDAEFDRTRARRHGRRAQCIQVAECDQRVRTRRAVDRGMMEALQQRVAAGDDPGIRSRPSTTHMSQSGRPMSIGRAKCRAARMQNWRQSPGFGNRT